jgi:AraC-like DNA-binding protein
MSAASIQGPITPGWFRTRSPEQAIQLCATAFYPHKLQFRGSPSGFGYLQHRTEVGPILLADLTYHADVSLGFGAERDSYYIHIPLSGELESVYRGERFTSTPELATIYGPDTELSVTRWPAGTRHLGVKIDRLAVDTALERLLGRPVESPVTFATPLAVSPGAVQSWVRQLLWMSTELAYPDNPMRQPAVLEPLVQGVIHGLLLMSDHSHRDALELPSQPVRPAAVREAMDLIEAAPQSALTTSWLAGQCHVSVRALQEGFRRHVGMSPMRYVQLVRLRRVHHDLRGAHPTQASVAAIARRWGFGHLGRFAAAYKATYGESPLQTLRGIG